MRRSSGVQGQSPGMGEAEAFLCIKAWIFLLSAGQSKISCLSGWCILETLLHHWQTRPCGK